MRDFVMSVLNTLKFLASLTPTKLDDNIVNIVLNNPGLIDLIVAVLEARFAVRYGGQARAAAGETAFGLTPAQHKVLADAGIHLSDFLALLDVIMKYVDFVRK